MNEQSDLLFDPLLKVLASQVDDLETLRIANSNRFAMLTRTEADADGVRRGLGLPEDHRDVKRMALTLESLAAVEKQAISQLQSHMRRSVWGPWLKQATGVGEKQLARLLGEIGDPYWNTLHMRPRMVSELWAYCGFHTLAASHSTGDTQSVNAGGTKLPTGQVLRETQDGFASGTQLPVGQSRPEIHSSPTDGGPRTAPKRQRGQKANWSEEARKRAWLIATSCVKAPAGSKYRTVYDETRAKYADAVHKTPCVRCGPKGKPAEIGSLLPPAHQHARALRAIAKEVLRDLWIEARRLHGELSPEVSAEEVAS